jgi:hypothetical protein
MTLTAMALRLSQHLAGRISQEQPVLERVGT